MTEATVKQTIAEVRKGLDRIETLIREKKDQLPGLRLARLTVALDQAGKKIGKQADKLVEASNGHA